MRPLAASVTAILGDKDRPRRNQKPPRPALHPAASPALHPAAFGGKGNPGSAVRGADFRLVHWRTARPGEKRGPAPPRDRPPYQTLAHACTRKNCGGRKRPPCPALSSEPCPYLRLLGAVCHTTHASTYRQGRPTGGAFGGLLVDESRAVAPWPWGDVKSLRDVNWNKRTARPGRARD